MRARKKDTGIVYALKIMDKKFITKENKTAYVKLERIVLDQLDHPGIVRLFFTFQDTFSLCRYSYLISFILSLSLIFLFYLSLSKLVLLYHILLYFYKLLYHLTFFLWILKIWHLNHVKVENCLIK